MRHVEGDMDDPTSLVFRADDFLMMSIDSPGSTQFDWDDESFLVKQMSLGDGVMSMNLHSHHNLTAFFSSTDSTEMEDKARNGLYVMLIVDNLQYDSWKAQVGFPVLEERTGKVHRKREGFFGLSGIDEVTKFEETRGLLMIHDLEIEIEDESLLDQDRIEELSGDGFQQYDNSTDRFNRSNDIDKLHNEQERRENNRVSKQDSVYPSNISEIRDRKPKEQLTFGLGDRDFRDGM